MTTETTRDSIDRLVLGWHRGAVTLPVPTLRTRVMASLAGAVGAAQGLWVLGVGVLGRSAAPHDPTHPAAEVPRLHALGIEAALLASEAGSRLIERGLALAAQASGRANATRLRAAEAGLLDGQPLLAIREPEAPADAMQALLLLRPSDAPAFGARERRLTERLAPHAMQALATARTLLEARHRAADPRTRADTAGPPAPAASALATGPAPLDALGTPAADPPGGGVAQLSDIERIVARLYAAGHTDREITERLGLPPGAVREHLRRVFAVLGVASRAQVGVLLG